MKKLILGLIAALCLSLAAIPQASASGLAPVKVTLTDSTTSQTVNLTNDINSCTVTASAGATFGGGTITAYTLGADGTTASTVSGVADQGNPSSTPTSTITAPGSWTFPVTSKPAFKVILTGSTGANIPTSIYCSSGLALLRNGSGGGAATPTPFAQAVANFCTTNSVVGCHYWPMNETTGTTMLDTIGTLNGTYSLNLNTAANFDPGMPMGMPDGSVGVDMWTAYGEVTGLPTPNPPEYVEGVVVRDCDHQNTVTAGPYIFDGYTTDTNHGQAIFEYQTAMQANYGTGSANTVANSLMGSYLPDCTAKLLIMVGFYTGTAQDDYWMVNGLPNADGVTNLAASSGLMVNGYISGGTPHSEGQGDTYCCMFYIPGNFNASQLRPLQAAFGK